MKNKGPLRITLNESSDTVVARAGIAIVQPSTAKQSLCL
jgi:hypothetical protein